MTLPNEAKAKPVSSLKAFFESKASQEIVESSQQEERTRTKTKIKISFIPVRPIEADESSSRSPSPFRLPEKLGNPEDDSQEIPAVVETTPAIKVETSESVPCEIEEHVEQDSREDLDDDDSGYTESNDISSHEQPILPTKSDAIIEITKEETSSPQSAKAVESRVATKTSTPLKASPTKNLTQTKKTAAQGSSCVKSSMPGSVTRTTAQAKPPCKATDKPNPISRRSLQSSTQSKPPISTRPGVQASDRRTLPTPKAPVLKVPISTSASSNVAKARPKTSATKDPVRAKPPAIDRPNSAGNHVSSSLMKPTAASMARTRKTSQE
ncbi:hypothetical protein NEOLI_003036 [Neolecta irregularis DAH-3]|uniref:Uncharacterized protein n=1 Tax=Neolecta irregularis (strain DAH-3) TaxID=1198029 RepID=A0A1U7LM48_NEOID|nr:hypothetical protein NEOLI_003036 [Neolecta irregularis DAH-3]|eukprot:OLL23622.1 hypothetical protein NEOLI_003036 [Neolecta irregularis DAH-3]